MEINVSVQQYNGGLLLDIICDARSVAAHEIRHQRCAATEGRQESMLLAEESAKCSSRSFFRAPRR